MPFERLKPQQQKNDQNDTDPQACEPGPSRLAGLDADGRGEPVDPERQPANEDHNVHNMHNRTLDLGE